MTNLIEAFLRSKSVELPTEPLDLSAVFQSQGLKCGYVIVMTGRSGSTWLASALSQVAGYGKPAEYFNEDTLPYYWDFSQPQDFSQAFRGVISRNSSDGCFGFKISPQRLFWLGRFVNLHKTFRPGLVSWIDMRRWNLVKQSISFAVAKKSGVWHSYTKGSTNLSQPDVEISDSDIWRELLSVVRQEQTMDKFCHNSGIVPLRIFYEELLDSKNELLARTCAFVRSEWSYDIANVIDGTAKLDKSKYTARELEFTKFNADVLNEIYSNRAKVNIDEMQRRVLADR